MDDGSRRCALPGCEALIEIIPGRPERRYCTAAHRSAARQARRASAQSAADARLADALPWLREPEGASVHAGPAAHRAAPTASPGAPLPCARRRAVPRLRGPRRTDPPPRRRRALAVLGAAGLLVGGYAIIASEPAVPVEAPVQAAPQEVTEEQWAARAQLALASLNRQLDTIAQTEETWNRVPESRHAGSPPSPVRALQERKVLLERRRATLQSQLAAYRSLEQTTDELRLSEQHLAAIERVLADLPPAGRRSPEQAAAIAALNEQRDLRVRQRDAKREELRSLSEGVQSARRTALPDDTQRTSEVSNEVLALSKDPRRGGTPTGPTTSRRPDAVGGRDEEDTRPRAEVGTSGPPDPRGPRDETREERRPAPESGARGSERGGAVGAVAGAVGGVVGGGNGSGSAAGGKTGAAKAKAAKPGERAGGKAVGRPAAEPAGGPVTATLGRVSGRLPDGSHSSDRARARGGLGAPAADGDRPSPRSAPATGSASGSGAGATSGSRDGAAAQTTPRRTPAEADPSGRSSATATPSSGPGGIASSVAGPMVRAATPSWAAPYAEAGLRQADREAAARMAGAGSGSSGRTPAASASGATPRSTSSDSAAGGSSVPQQRSTGGAAAESASSGAVGGTSASASREMVATGSSS